MAQRRIRRPTVASVRDVVPLVRSAGNKAANRLARRRVTSVDAGQAHSYKAKQNTCLLRRIDQDFLESTVDLHCRELMRMFFPELHGLDHAIAV